MLSERDQTEDCIDVKDSDAVLAIDDEPNNFDVLHYSRERLQGIYERLGTPISVHRKFGDHFRMKWQIGGVVATHGIDVLVYNPHYLIAHGISQRLFDPEDVRSIEGSGGSCPNQHRLKEDPINAPDVLQPCLLHEFAESACRDCVVF